MIMDTAINMHTKLESLLKTNKQQALLRLLQLSSPTLPVGAYAYSQGLEWVAEANWIRETDELETWLKGLLQGSLHHVDIPIMKRLYQACLNNKLEKIKCWNDILLAYRETAEVRKEELDKGHALAELLKGLEINNSELIFANGQTTFLTGYCCAAVTWQIELQDAAQAYLWGWLENQLVCAMKIMPLGQIASQKILSHLIGVIPGIVNDGLQILDQDIGSILPAQAVACALHETQYTRLFRS